MHDTCVCLQGRQVQPHGGGLLHIPRLRQHLCHVRPALHCQPHLLGAPSAIDAQLWLVPCMIATAAVCAAVWASQQNVYYSSMVLTPAAALLQAHGVQERPALQRQLRAGDRAVEPALRHPQRRCARPQVPVRLCGMSAGASQQPAAMYQQSRTPAEYRVP
jgi:hypothetical protein